MKIESNKIMVQTYSRSATIDDDKMKNHQKLLQEYCDSKGYEILKSHIDNRYSGINLNRPALQGMLEDMRLGKFKKLIVLNMDRLSRSLSDFEYLFKEFKKYNCEVEFVMENIDTANASGKLFTNVLELLNQYKYEVLKDGRK